MKKTGKILVSLLLILILSGVFSVFAACKSDYMVKFNLNGGTATIPEQTIKSGQKATRPTAVPTKENFSFDNWYESLDANAAKFDFNKAITMDTTVYAKYTAVAPAKYAVNFITGEGGSTIAAQEVTKGGFATMPTTPPTREGYTFTGWFTEAGGTTAFNFATTAINQVTNVYAGWQAVTPAKYTVNFITGEGGSTIAAQEVTTGGFATMPTTPPTREGYTFTGWFTEAGGTTAFNFATTAINQVTNVYAGWELIEEPVGGEEPEPSSFSLAGNRNQNTVYNKYNNYNTTNKNTTYYTANNTAAKNNALNNAANNTVADRSNAVNNTSNNSANNIAATSFNNTANNSAVSRNTAVNNTATNRTANTMTNGINNTANNSVANRNNAVNTINNSTANNTASNLTNNTVSNTANNVTTGTANNTSNQNIANYKVNYNLGEGGTGVDNATAGAGGFVRRPAVNPVRKGYKFNGWFTEQNGNVPFDFEKTSINAETNVYAGWASEGRVLLDAINSLAENGFMVRAEGSLTVNGETTDFKDLSFKINAKKKANNVVNNNVTDIANTGNSANVNNMSSTNNIYRNNNAGVNNVYGSNSVSGVNNARNTNAADKTNINAERTNVNTANMTNTVNNANRTSGNNIYRNNNVTENKVYGNNTNGINNFSVNNIENMPEPYPAFNSYPVRRTGFNNVRGMMNNIKRLGLNENSVMDLFTATNSGNGMTYTMNSGLSSAVNSILGENDNLNYTVSIKLDNADNISEIYITANINSGAARYAGEDGAIIFNEEGQAIRISNSGTNNNTANTANNNAGINTVNYGAANSNTTNNTANNTTNNATNNTANTGARTGEINNMDRAGLTTDKADARNYVDYADKIRLAPKDDIFPARGPKTYYPERRGGRRSRIDSDAAGNYTTMNDNMNSNISGINNNAARNSTGINNTSIGNVNQNTGINNTANNMTNRDIRNMSGVNNTTNQNMTGNMGINTVNQNNDVVYLADNTNEGFSLRLELRLVVSDIGSAAANNNNAGINTVNNTNVRNNTANNGSTNNTANNVNMPSVVSGTNSAANNVNSANTVNNTGITNRANNNSAANNAGTINNPNNTNVRYNDTRSGRSDNAINTPPFAGTVAR